MKKVTAALIAAAVALAPTARADSYDFELPQRWSDDLAPGSHCATPGRKDTYVEATRRWFKQTDATSVANDTEEAVPVTHTVKEKRVQTLEVSGTVTPKGDLVKNVSRAYGWKYVHQVSWAVNQKVGPYTLEPGTWGRLVWGFTMLDGDAQDVKCSADQVWEPVGKPYEFSVPEARYSELKVDESSL